MKYTKPLVPNSFTEERVELIICVSLYKLLLFLVELSFCVISPFEGNYSFPVVSVTTIRTPTIFEAKNVVCQF